MMRKCKRCQTEKPLEDFHKCKSIKLGRHYTCKTCVKKYQIKDDGKNNKRWKTKRKEYTLWLHAKYRANAKGIPFDILESDIVIPDFCPILGIPILRDANKNSWNSPSLDRIIPEKGYVKGNVCVISWRANTIKSYGNADEHRKIADFIDMMLHKDTIDISDYSI